MNKLYEENSIQDIANSIRTKYGYTGKNLLNKNNVNRVIITGHFAYITTGGKIDQLSSGDETNNTRLFYVKCKPNTTYTISKTQSSTMRAGTIATKPKLNDVLQNYVQIIGTSLTITSGLNDNYLVVQLWATNEYIIGTLDWDTVKDNLQVEESNSPSPYEPFCRYKTSEMDEAIDNIPSGRGIEEYFNIYPTNGPFSSSASWINTTYLIKYPEIIIDNTVTNLQYTFASNKKLEIMKIIGGQNVDFMYRAFYQSSALTNIDLSELEVNKCDTMGDCFNGCSSLINIDFSNYTPINTVSMYSMFYGCSNLTSVDLSGIENVSSVRQLFYSCRSLMHIDIRKMKLNNSTAYTDMFGGSGSSSRVPYTCEIIVADDTQKQWMNLNFANYTNVKTVAEYEAE